MSLSEKFRGFMPNGSPPIDYGYWNSDDNKNRKSGIEEIAQPNLEACLKCAEGVK